MGKVKLKLSSLEELDMGKVEKMFEGHVHRVLTDIEDRPGDTTVRKINLEITAIPADAEGDTVDMEFSVKSSVPIHRSRKYNMRMQHVGGKRSVVFNPESADDVKQGTLDEAKKGS